MQRSLFRDTKLAYLFSFLAISILPVLVCIALLGANNLSAYRQQQDSSVVYGMHQFTNNYLIYMEIMDACTEHLDDRIADGLTKAEIPAQLASYEKNYPQLSSIFYFEKTSSRIFTHEGEMNYSDFERRMQADYGINLTEMAFYSTLCQTQIDDTLVSGKPEDDESNRYLFYMKVLPRLDPAPKRVMVFMLPIHAVIGHLDEYVPAGYSVYSYSDRYLTYLVQKGEDYMTNRLQPELAMLQSENLMHERIDGQKYVLLRVKSGVDGMYHMIAYRESTLYHDAYQSILHSFVPIFIILAITAAAAFMMHRYFYRGIERILALPFPVENAMQFRDPYAYIETNAKHMLNQNRQMVTDIRHHNTMQLLRGLFHGSPEDIQLIADASESENFKSFMPYSLFTVGYARGAALPESLSRDFVSAEMPQFECTFWMMPVCGGAAAAILINHEPLDADMLIRNCAYFLKKQGVAYDSLGMGLAQDEPDMVQISLMQAQVASQSGSGMHLYAPGAHFDELMPIAEQRMICKSILSGDSESAVFAFDSLVKKLQNVTLGNRISHEWHLFMLESILGTLRDELKTDIAAEWDVNSMLQLYAGRSDDRFREFIRHLAEQVRAERERKCGAQQNAISAYVSEHILDSDLSPASVGAAFHLTEAAVASAIRESTGMTFAKYVNHLKMEYVCDQLRSTNRPIKEIIAEIGYADVSNFTRKFRLQYGCTPSAFRENARTNQ